MNIKIKIKKYFFSAAALMFAAAPAFAGRPLITDDAYTLGKNTVQLELAADYERFSAENAQDSLIASPVIGYGLTDRLDLVLAPQYVYDITNKTADTALEAHVKWRVFEGEKFFFALKPGITTSLERKDVGAYSAYAVATYNMGAFDFHANTGYVAHNEEGQITDSWHNSLAGEWNFYGDFKLVANAGFDYEENMNSNFPFFLLSGLCYSPSENLDLDLGFKRMFRLEEGQNWALLAGVTLRI